MERIGGRNKPRPLMTPPPSLLLSLFIHSFRPTYKSIAPISLDMYPRSSSSFLLQASISLTVFAMLATCVSGASYGRFLIPVKRSFDSFGSSGFGGFDKRSFDTFGGLRFSPLEKRAFDTVGSSGFFGLEKRAFDSFGNSFGGFDRRK
ncbi:hypothetical protein PENTCL1PPCAC_22524 [Pristionchus entomophagus]|uniref:Uncharacterized protein n=1 Tax=Pristionchus entomophagus TaxID=358040 RepID=A0AAV5U0L7_9BILA|nr:hypothetical protein PENTCL1PPCAC_22524 [Pristionchus entomophagus]